MDAKTTKIIVIVVAVIAVVAIAAFVLMNNNGGGNNDDKKGEFPELSTFPARLAIVGNANCDDYLDSKDVAYVEKLIKESNFDYSKEYMCDANLDGYINEDDVDIIKKMVTYDQDTVYYLAYMYTDVIEPMPYNMNAKNKYVCPLIAPPLDTCLILGQDLIKGADDRIAVSTGSAYDRYTTALDMNTLINVGNCGTPDKEAIATLLEKYDNCITIVCGQKDYYAKTTDEDFKGTGLQIIRMTSWEYGMSIHGLLTTGYLLERLDNAYKYLEWYEGVEKYVDTQLSKLSSSEKVKAICFYPEKGSEGQFCLLGNTSAENKMLTALNSYDLGTTIYNAHKQGGMEVTGDKAYLSKEQLTSDIEKYEIDTIIAMCNAPVNKGATTAYFEGIYNKWNAYMGEIFGPIDYMVTGSNFASGVTEVICKIEMGYYLYPELFSYEDLKKYTNEVCNFIHIQDKWNFNNMNQIYGDKSELNVMNMD